VSLRRPDRLSFLSKASRRRCLLTSSWWRRCDTSKGGGNKSKGWRRQWHLAIKSRGRPRRQGQGKAAAATARHEQRGPAPFLSRSFSRSQDRVEMTLGLEATGRKVLLSQSMRVTVG
jgi:hypothetical protein